MSRSDTGRTLRPLAEVVKLAIAGLNGRAPAREVLEEVRHLASAAEWDVWSDRSIITGIRSALRTKNASGVAEHYALNGEYVAVRLFSIEMFEQCARQHARLSGANASKVHALSSLCLEAHGRTFDADRVLSEERAA